MSNQEMPNPGRKQERVYEPLENEVILEAAKVSIDTLKSHSLTKSQRDEFERIYQKLSKFVDKVLEG